MIESTKYQIYEDRALYFLWGYATLFCAGLHYILGYSIGYQHPYVAWMLMPVAIVFHFVLLSKRTKTERPMTFPARVMAGIWGGMFLALVGIVIAGFGQGFYLIYPFFLMLYGIACYATGSALQFRYLTWGGFGAIALGTLAFFVPFQYQLLLLMLGITISYILPAHLMRPEK